MRPILTFAVQPALPESLKDLQTIAHNLRWSWNHDSVELFRRTDRELWEQTSHNPVELLGKIDQERLEDLAQDEGFLDHYARVRDDLQAYLNSRTTWYERTCGRAESPLLAYFSAEFGLTDCMPIYSGGLGVLAGDHMKSASELGLPLVGVGLLYQQGYFRQYLNADGWQQELNPENDFLNMPIQLLRTPADEPLMIQVDLPGRKVFAQIWKLHVGRITIYFLDTNVEKNNAEDQDITDQLYGGDLELRLKQEIVLGIGGTRALAALDLHPKAYHMNEGHSAFLALERIRMLMKERQLSYAEARELTRSSNVFTTHTPVAAGHDYFPVELMDKYLKGYHEELGLSRKDFMALGRKNPDDEAEHFCMTILAMRLAVYRNAVSRLHKHVSQKMWNVLWPELPEQEVPITHITNGIHFRSILSREMKDLFDRYLGHRWRTQPADQTVWQTIEEIPVLELWRTHEKRRERLVAFVRRRVPRQVQQRGGTQSEVEAARELLDPDILTIGFARRFATYKRAALILTDEERLRKLLTDPERPLQLVFAGKAHPKDEEGKNLIRKIIHYSRDERVRSRIVFIEDYDMGIARYMVQGVDVWLNTPLRPREASGTSGMKASFNGALNLSTLDGWWDEAYSPEIGWTIGRDETYDSPELQNAVESNAIYELLEKEIIPLFYNRDRDGVPRQWVNFMKASMAAICPRFNTNRMVRDYAEKFYLPAVQHFDRLTADSFAQTRALASWKAKIASKWQQVQIRQVHTNGKPEIKVGDTVQVKAQVQLGELTPDDVAVELYFGRLDTKDHFVEPQSIPMKYVSASADNSHLFVADAVMSKTSGKHGYTVRVLPKHKDQPNSIDLGIVRWAS